ncbi:hypothetical protein D9M71_794790 [compost metagenome]
MHQQAFVMGQLVHPGLHQVGIALRPARCQCCRRSGADGPGVLGVIKPAFELGLVPGLLAGIERRLVGFARFGKALPGRRFYAALADP